MRRIAHGGTCKPGPCRPASGYGQPVGRPGPEWVQVRRPVGSGALLDSELLGHLGESGGEAWRR